MVQSPMISSPLKQTSEIDWIQPLKTYIRQTYGDDPERYSEECATLNRLRQDMRGAGKDSAAGRDLLYRYYVKASLLAAVAGYYQAIADDEGTLYGISIARLQLAEKQAITALSWAKTFPSSPPAGSNLSADTGPILLDLTRRQLANIQEKLASFTKDNDFIYHQPVPSEPSLSTIAKLPAAKAIPVSELYQGQDIQRIIGPDIFQKIVPMSVTESASLYDEEKAKLVRAEAEKVEAANGEMAASLDYLKLPGSLNILKGGMDQDMDVDEDFKMWCEELANAPPFREAFNELQEDKISILSVLDQCSKQLDMEESVCEKMRSKYGADWVQQPSSRLTSTLRSDVRNYRDTIDEASSSDSQLLVRLRQHEADFDEMRSAGETDEADVLFQRALIKVGGKHSKGRNEQGSPYSAAPETNLLGDDFDARMSVTEQIARVEELLKKLNLVKRDRNQILKDLKEKKTSFSKQNLRNSDLTKIDYYKQTTSKQHS
ncbi:predicted protein [Histoplasma mississippiense (nom. inval.)]|uniref:predicted protein n=1 Tax=Ajellomyces capsulatus (strain NAm1 / WU24) TaxID=2059318 RepID=UPI000157CE72|nr:predicted protein [Histoplasma mississippiense (nom. inval.)]EDN10707.1 predicted protein [Histoplasma mississippiense (nom. inval.)]